MKPELQIKALAELDGWSEHETEERQFCYPGGQTFVKCLRWFKDFVANPFMMGGVRFDELPNYLTSYDAIIPLIQKQDWKIRNEIECKLLDNIGSVVESTPTQLCEALLRSVGKWKD